ncbi:riboflavin biosynthesis protein RibF [Paenibacillus mendelii]|uniref:Riboflavin biosynthesis protein n=1 Tax=Paenibacillus mendelii TaxID=206163 RepID=A0ABV6JG35_9BACL|nr:riboflavin biosynthesis protein RibF [Paenibacillus mendelii]MCQ6557382.1 riboflavin biosynthesis protein RibF [Paenibacillus mendelii]
MEVINITNLPPVNKEPLVLCLGQFDGLHRGHQYLLEQARQLLELDDTLAVWSFNLHPPVMKEEDKIGLSLLTPVAERRNLLVSYGVKKLYEGPSFIDPAEFSLETFVLEQAALLNVRQIVVGETFCVGNESASSVEMLQQLCNQIGTPVTVVPAIKYDGRAISSTTIREQVKAGQVGLANELLGRHYTIQGIVAHGNKIGRTLGFPTANLDHIDDYVEPSPGVYMGMTEIYDSKNDRMESWKCLISAGYRPTVGGKTYKVEAYLLDYSGDLYGQTISVSFVERLRGEIRFPSLDALIVQMHEDERKAREAFGMPTTRSVPVDSPL